MNSIKVPRVRTDGKGYDSRNQTVEVEEKEECPSIPAQLMPPL